MKLPSINLAKLTRRHVLIIGGVVCVLIVIGFIMLGIRPKIAQRAELTKKLQAAQQVANKEDEVKRALAEAEKELNKYTTTFNRYWESRMLPVDLEYPDEAMTYLWIEHTEYLPPWIRYIARRAGCEVTNLTIDAPPTDPSSINQEVIKVPINLSVTAPGFPNALEFIRNLTRTAGFNRLIIVNSEMTFRGPESGFAEHYVKVDLGLTEFILPKGVAEAVTAEAPATTAAPEMGYMGMPGGMPSTGMPSYGAPGRTGQPGGPGMQPGGPSRR